MFHQVPVNPSLYLIKYDGFDCVYGLELHKDERVQGLEVLPDRLGKAEGEDMQLNGLVVFLKYCHLESELYICIIRLQRDPA